MTLEEQEAFDSLCMHYGLPVMIKLIDSIINNIKGDAFSVGISEDPQKAGMQLLKERMKYEGAIALKNAMSVKIREAKTRASATQQRS